MAITITTLPAAKASAYLPVILECTSARNNSTTLAVTSVINNGGNAEFVLASNSQFKTNNVVELSHFLINTSYNGTFDIISDTSTSFTISLPFVSTDTGRATITNNNFKIKGELYVFDQTKYSITGIANLGSGLIEVTTSTAHGYNLGSIIYIRGTTNYNDRYAVLLSTTSTTFIIVATYVSSQTGTVQGATLIGTKYQSPITINGSDVFRFSFAGMLQAVLSFDLYTTYPAGVQIDTPNSIKVYCILLTEVYDSADGTTGEHDNLLSAYRYALNCTLQHEEVQSLTTIYELGASTQKFLTDSPAIQKVRVGEEVQLAFLGKPQTAYKTAYEQFDASGNSLGANFSIAFLLVDDRGAFCINQNNILSSSISRVDFWMANTSNIQVSEKKTFVIVNKPLPFYRRIYFFNLRGSFDSFTFEGSYKSTRNRKKNRFAKSRPVTFAITDRGSTILSTNTNPTKAIFSRMLTNAESVWLEQLFDSNTVYLLESEASTKFIPIDVADDAQPEESSDGAAPMKQLTYTKANEIIIQVN